MKKRSEPTEVGLEFSHPTDDARWRAYVGVWCGDWRVMRGVAMNDLHTMVGQSSFPDGWRYGPDRCSIPPDQH